MKKPIASLVLNTAFLGGIFPYLLNPPTGSTIPVKTKEVARAICRSKGWELENYV